MMRYTQLAFDSYLDMETFKVVSEKDLLDWNEVSCCFPLWRNSKEPSRVLKTSKGAVLNAKCSSSMFFNGFVVDFSSSGDCAVIQIGNRLLKLSFVCRQSCGVVSISTQIDYTLVDGADMRENKYSNVVRLGESSFHNILDLATICYDKLKTDRLNFGVESEQFHIIFKERDIGSCYALLVGTWAILMDDEFRFDSIVALNGANSYKLDVNAFLYTVNPYIVKVMMLSK